MAITDEQLEQAERLLNVELRIMKILKSLDPEKRGRVLVTLLELYKTNE